MQSKEAEVAMKDIVVRIILAHRCHATPKDRRLHGIMPPISRHSPIKIKVNVRIWYDVIIVALNCFREWRLDMRDRSEGLNASSLEAILAYHNATDPARDTNYEGNIIL